MNLSRSYFSKTLILFKGKYKNKFIEWLFYSTAFTLPFVRAHWNSKIIVLLLFVSLIDFDPKFFLVKLKENRIILLVVALFILDVIGLIHSENLRYGLRYLETKIPILVLPILILINSEILDRKIINNIFWSFVLGVLVILIGYIIIISTEIIENGFSYNYFLSERLSNIPVIANQTIIDIHPSFLSMYLSFSALFILIYLQSQPVKIRRLIPIVILISICLFQIWLNSRAGLIGFVIVLIFFLFYQSQKKIKSLLFVLFFIIALLVVPFTRERFVFAPLRALQNIGEVNAKDPDAWPISFRFQILDCSISLLKNNHWIWGYGTGDFRDKINQCYVEKEYGWIVVRDFDAHNEYFAQLHRHGILGLFLFISCLVIPLKIAFDKKQTLYIVFLFLIIISCLPETLLSSQKGVVFYALFNSLLFLRGINVPLYLHPGNNEV